MWIKLKKYKNTIKVHIIFLPIFTLCLLFPKFVWSFVKFQKVYPANLRGKIFKYLKLLSNQARNFFMHKRSSLQFARCSYFLSSGTLRLKLNEYWDGNLISLFSKAIEKSERYSEWDWKHRILPHLLIMAYTLVLWL